MADQKNIQRGKLRLQSEIWINQNNHILWTKYVKGPGVIDLSTKAFNQFCQEEYENFYKE